MFFFPFIQPFLAFCFLPLSIKAVFLPWAGQLTGKGGGWGGEERRRSLSHLSSVAHYFILICLPFFPPPVASRSPQRDPSLQIPCFISVGIATLCGSSHSNASGICLPEVCVTLTWRGGIPCSRAHIYTKNINIQYHFRVNRYLTGPSWSPLSLCVAAGRC